MRHREWEQRQLDQMSDREYDRAYHPAMPPLGFDCDRTNADGYCCDQCGDVTVTEWVVGEYPGEEDAYLCSACMAARLDRRVDEGFVPCEGEGAAS
jgi:hypothetical protein